MAKWCAAARPVASYEALNDIVVGKTQIARMIDLETYVDSQFVSTFKADGLIVSTPTGSTAYSLSAGGPILFPAVAAICITPVCPHMLTNRPVLVPDTSVIEIISKLPAEEAYLTVDGQVGELLISRRPRGVPQFRAQNHLIRPPKMFFFDVLREKLKWGETLKRPSLTAWIFIAMLLGVTFGAMFPNLAKRVHGCVWNVFLRLIKSIIAPLIFGTLVYGIAGTGSVKTMGRIGVKAIVYFEVAHHHRA